MGPDHRKSPFPTQKKALGPILNAPLPLPLSDAAASHPPPPPVAGVASLSALRKEVLQAEVEASSSAAYTKPYAQTLPSNPTKSLPTMMLPPMGKTPGQLGELKGLLRAPAPYLGQSRNSNNINNAETESGDRDYAASVSVPGGGRGLLATAILLGDEDGMSLNATWPFHHKDARLTRDLTAAASATSTTRRAQPSSAAIPITHGSPPKGRRPKSRRVRPDGAGPEAGVVLSPRSRTLHEQSERRSQSPQRGRTHSPSHKIFREEHAAAATAAAAGAARQPRVRTDTSERPKGASLHRTGARSAPLVERPPPRSTPTRNTLAYSPEVQASHDPDSAHSGGGGDGESDRSAGTMYAACSTPRLEIGGAAEYKAPPPPTTVFKEIDELAQLLAMASRRRAAAGGGNNNCSAGAGAVAGAGAGAGACAGGDRTNAENDLCFEVEWVAARTYPFFFETIVLLPEDINAAQNTMCNAEDGPDNGHRADGNSNSTAFPIELDACTAPADPEHYTAEDFEDDDLDILIDVNMGATDANKEKKVGDTFLYEDGNGGDTGGESSGAATELSENTLEAESPAEPLLKASNGAQRTKEISALDAKYAGNTEKENLLKTTRLTENALAAVLEQTFELVSVAVTNASNTVAIAGSSALLGSALLCATLKHRGQQQAAYTKIATLCSARLQELEQTHAADFYIDDRVTLKFEQLCKLSCDRALRQDDDGGIPVGPTRKTHHPFAPYLLMLGMAVTPSVHAAVAEAVEPHSGMLPDGILSSVMPLGEMLERYLGRGAQRQPRDALTTDICRISVKFDNLADAVAAQVALAATELGPPLSMRHIQKESEKSSKESTIHHQIVAVHKYEPKRLTTWGELIDGIDPTFYSRVEEEAASDWPDVKIALADVRALRVSFLVEVNIGLEVVGLRKQKSLAYSVCRAGSWPRLQAAFASAR